MGILSTPQVYLDITTNYHDISYTHPKPNIAPEKKMVGLLLCYWEGNFSGALLNFQGVSTNYSLEKQWDCWSGTERKDILDVRTIMSRYF